MPGINLRQEMDVILEEHGYRVILLRSSRKIRCRWVNPQTNEPCWNERSQEANSRCPECMGTGWITRAEVHQIRRDNASQVVSLPGVTGTQEPGRIWTPANNFYFRHDVHPQTGDMIFEVGWKGNRPVDLHAVHAINHTEPHRGDRGRIEYYGCATRLVTLDRPFRDEIFPLWISRNRGPLLAYSVTGGDGS